MRIFRSAREAGTALPCPVAVIGKFDALHRGHQRVLRAAVRRARALKTPCVVVTFDPSPREHLRLFPRRPLLSLAQRLELLRELGVDGVLVLSFGPRMACMSPVAFGREILGRRLRPIAVFVGEDFCFGRDRAGRIDTLRAIGAVFGFTVRAVPLVKAGGEKISASRIRALLESGRRAAAEELLGRPLPA